MDGHPVMRISWNRLWDKNAQHESQELERGCSTLDYAAPDASPAPGCFHHTRAVSESLCFLLYARV
ncbi:Coiled-coil domain-containing protein 81 [Clarias magur]|uniref:Coiled-coil domain-containing protein 81 n=1 Tax=Clarias magur TaxID=1594786 RepID=A0A8J4U5T0_CLAMG|nr:Coiled-coil domain-containing protein 81 [Clarias magur]